MIDLTEIASARGGEKSQEQFELFAREFLEAIGFKCISGPDRGADDGKDLLVREDWRGAFWEHSKHWLVSVKHYAHSGRAVGVEDEVDPAGRVQRHGADGFIAFYSTVPSASLGRSLDVLRARMPCIVIDEGRIRSQLHEDVRLRGILERYLPRSFAQVHRKQVEARIHFLSSLGLSFFSEQQGSLPGPAMILDEESGRLRFDDRHQEPAMLASFILNQFKTGNYRVLESLISFDPEVWRYLRALLQVERGSLAGLGEAILTTNDPFFCRMLIIIAGEAEQRDAIVPICKTVLHDGWPFHRRIKESQATVTPFFDVAEQTLKRIAHGQAPVLEEFAAKAKKLERWHQYSIFRLALESA
ncbi:MAG TPA: restriction endonuclease [Longimicrobium sp.]|jgi:hypothetical protein|uniref:restriction endonuclease n=1 Tax=Longimicrobium sp. TaxID=2029185 RepID=UPI002EDB2C5D